jgi:hypothetical protein
MHLLDQLPGCGAQAQRDPLTSVPTYASATTGRVCAPEHHPRTTRGRRGWGVSVLSVGGTVWLYDELAVKLLRCGPSFSSLRSKGSTHACTRITLGTPVTYDGTPEPTILDKHPPTRAGSQNILFSWPRLRAAAAASMAIRQADVHFCCCCCCCCCCIGSATGYICTYVNVNNPRSWFLSFPVPDR